MTVTLYGKRDIAVVAKFSDEIGTLSWVIWTGLMYIHTMVLTERKSESERRLREDSSRDWSKVL